MGNADIRDLAVIEEVPFADLSGSVVAVDAHNWLYRYLTTTVKWTDDAVYTTDDGTEVANLVGVVQGLPKFFEHDLTPVFVFDGAVTDLKDDEVAQRREQRERAEEKLEAARERGDSIAVARLESRTQRLTDVILSTTRELLGLLDVPVVEAPAEGEVQAAHMARRDDVDHVGTEDYDALLLGAPMTLRQLTSKGDPELMDFQATLDRHDLTWEQLVDAAVLMGTDFNEGISGIGPKTAVDLVREHGDIWTVFEARDVYVEDADRIRDLFLDPAVTDDYALDTDLSPDVDAARAFVCDEWTSTRTRWRVASSASRRASSRPASTGGGESPADRRQPVGSCEDTGNRRVVTRGGRTSTPHVRTSPRPVRGRRSPGVSGRSSGRRVPFRSDDDRVGRCSRLGRCHRVGRRVRAARAVPNAVRAHRSRPPECVVTRPSVRYRGAVRGDSMTDSGTTVRSPVPTEKFARVSLKRTRSAAPAATPEGFTSRRPSGRP